VFGLARNKRLEAMIADELAEAKAAFAATDKAARVCASAPVIDPFTRRSAPTRTAVPS
jgi:hypothetical protein